MIVERFHPGKVKMLYERLADKGRLMPGGLNYVSSWIDENVTICYQVMEADAVEKVHEWISHWNDLADFEVIPVITSAQARTRILAE